MVLDDFNALTDNEKANVVWSGTFLADREENGLAEQLPQQQQSKGDSKSLASQIEGKIITVNRSDY